ncbi:hypothetical protein JAAARDRAFT_207410 [Jaapia argillacea MUCL 33604]|uniref:Zn(2)-C6 fungal-type domain-containing protein n=1 Tax=Jaapia argillacea MUCL 33604 TaxID=933084 RepID=A0A067PQN2_9AGAM|nr:hypothetical protein JAAARDRAFT_207410 [Jaapia argillacea MUCL 33604]
MTSRGGGASTSSSPSPSSAYSLDMSPASRTSALHVSGGSDEGEPSSSRLRRNSDRPDLTRSHSSGKGGCWTCRTRRKKCDEQRVGDSCQTCLRLKIQCLGWGPKPDCVKDKAAQEVYKSQIKSQLTRQGMIRGVPKLIQSPQPPSSSSHSRQSNVATHSPIPSGLPMNNEYHSDYEQQHQPSPQPMAGPSEYPDDLSRQSSHHPSPLPPAPPSLVPQGGQYQHYPALGLDPVPEAHAPAELAHDHSSVEGEHVIYYFQHVQKLQYPFSDSALTDALYRMVVQQPRGAVTNAICALASLHYTLSHASQDPDLAEDPDISMANQWYDQAYIQLATSKHFHGHYTESDAVAALHLVNYSLLGGGSIDWVPMLEVAKEWLSHTGLVQDENPTLRFLGMSYSEQFVARVTLWMDVVSSVTLTRPPVYLALYRRMFTPDPTWTGSIGGGQGLRMDILTGCPDEVLLSIAETSNLASWKAHEKARGTLSVRELVHRGRLIEQDLRRARPRLNLDSHQHLESRISTPDSHASFATGVSSFESPAPMPAHDARRAVVTIFYETAILYLNTVISDFHPGVPEISASVDALAQLFNQMDASAAGRSIILPLCLAGCLMTSVTHREILASTFTVHQDSGMGFVGQARTLVEAVWHRRDTTGEAVDWRDMMRTLEHNLLLV